MFVFHLDNLHGEDGESTYDTLGIHQSVALAIAGTSMYGYRVGGVENLNSAQVIILLIPKFHKSKKSCMWQKDFLKPIFN